MKYKIIKRFPVKVSKKEYIEHWIDKLKLMEQALISFRIKATKEINTTQKRIDEIKKELNEIQT